ncbi:hypothetical protein Tco_0595936 [Tanacetum coccineum]
MAKTVKTNKGSKSRSQSCSNKNTTKNKVLLKRQGLVGRSILNGIYNWLFDINALINSMNYKPVVAGNQSNDNAGTKACDDAGKARVETVPGKDYIMLPLWTQDPPFSSSLNDSPDAGFKPSREE